jgi:hypothetical protein
MTMWIAVPAAAANGIRTALDAQTRSARARAEFVGASIAALVPAVWSGDGLTPIGWTVPIGSLSEPGGTRVAFAATDAFAAGKAQFSGAADALPADWQR